jgi:hypothetical protein
MQNSDEEITCMHDPVELPGEFNSKCGVKLGSK